MAASSVSTQAGSRRFNSKSPQRCATAGISWSNYDWWNYGGLTRDVTLIETPRTFIRDYSLALDPTRPERITGFVQLDGPELAQRIRVSVGDAGEARATTDSQGRATFELPAPSALWSPQQPRLLAVRAESETDSLEERIGFRTIRTRDQDILLNGRPLFLRGISLHEEAPGREGRATTPEDARALLGWAKELGANFVRLAHYPHNEHIVRAADEIGLLVWSEIPVYWTIDWANAATLGEARRTLAAMIERDRNRASVIFWSIGNETPPTEARLGFMRDLALLARRLDPTRLITAALELRFLSNESVTVDDPLGEFLDVLGCNEYLGWYYGSLDAIERTSWSTPYRKPLIISEFGADAKFGLRGSDRARFTEEHQAAFYEQQISMLRRIPFLRGVSPWILKDFRSPKRPLSGIQDYWNRKGLISEKGERKEAFGVLQRYYREIESTGRHDR
jgi:beta-glucuronidase